MRKTESHDIVIVGGGISGLATALALHRKGLNSIVLERSDTLRAAGLAIGVFTSGWRALDQLGVGPELRQKAFRLSGVRDIMLPSGAKQDTLYGNMEVRCLKRSDLIETLANGLPSGSLCFGFQIVAIGEDPVTSFPVVHLHNGSIIHAKVLIGCDGVNSVVAKSLGLQDPKYFSIWVTRGFTYFPDCHNLKNFFLRMRDREGVIFGRLPINDNLVHWFTSWRSPLPGGPYPELQKDQDPELLKDAMEKMLKAFPEEVITMVRNSESSSLLLSHIPYRSPQALLSGKMWKGTVTIAGDSMHVMGPFLGQGGNCCLEDAIVLARNLARAIQMDQEGKDDDQQLKKNVQSAFDRYVKERKWRVMRLSTQSYFMGLLFQTTSKVVQLALLLLLYIFFGGLYSLSHVNYDCGRL